MTIHPDPADANATAAGSPAPRRRWMARLTDACRGPRALPAFGAISFLESSLLPVPIDLALAPLCLARRGQFLLIVLVGTIGSLLGAVLGYLIGAFFMETVGSWLLDLYNLSDQFTTFRAIYDEAGWMAVVVAGITPIPFKVAAILSGAAGMRFDLFILAAFGVRFARFSLVTGVYMLFGAGLQKLLTNHARLFTVAAIVVTVLGMLAVPLMM